MQGTFDRTEVFSRRLFTSAPRFPSPGQMENPARIGPVCRVTGCGEISNGIEPPGYCARHFREYTEWLASRTDLYCALERTVDDIQSRNDLRSLRTICDAFGIAAAALVIDSPTPAAEIAGVMMDRLAQFSELATYETRPAQEIA
jgi:hypothetical protein